MAYSNYDPGKRKPLQNVILFKNRHLPEVLGLHFLDQVEAGYSVVDAIEESTSFSRPFIPNTLVVGWLRRPFWIPVLFSRKSWGVTEKYLVSVGCQILMLGEITHAIRKRSW